MAENTVSHEERFDKIREELNVMSEAPMGALRLLAEALQKDAQKIRQVCCKPDGELREIDSQSLIGIAELLRQLYGSFEDRIDAAISHLPKSAEPLNQ